MAENDTPYEVGYGKPPKHSRFVKGKSGNPRGRPKKRKTGGRTPVERVFDEKVDLVGVDGRTRSLSGRSAMYRGLIAAALKGDLKAIKALLRELLELTRDQVDVAKGKQAGPPGGVVLMPEILDLDEWEALAIPSQAALHRATMEGV